MQRAFKEAIYEAERLYEGSRPDGDVSLAAYGARTMMKTHYQMGSYEEAFRYGGELLNMLEGTDVDFIHSVYQFLAILFYELKEYEEAIEILEKIGQLAMESDDHVHLIEVYLSEGNRHKLKNCLMVLDELSTKLSSECDLKYYYENYTKYYELIEGYPAYMNMARAGYVSSFKDVSVEWIGREITTSIGIVSSRDIDTENLLLEADRAMYVAKKSGKGCYILG